MTRPIRADGVQSEEAEWLWRDRIPVGMVTTVAGRMGAGKGLYTAHLTADVTRRGINVLYSASEDSFGIMTRPRLEAAGADLKRVYLTRFQVPDQMPWIEEQVREKNIGLIVMDPFASHLGRGYSRYADNVRQALQPLVELAEGSRLSVVIVEHVIKKISPNGHILNVIGGSGSGLAAVSRAVYVLGPDPGDPDLRVLAQAKLNIAVDRKPLSFETDTTELRVMNRGSGEMVKADIPFLMDPVETESFDPLTMFVNTAAKPGRPPSKRAEAAEWLTEYLVKKGKPVKAGLVFEDAKQSNITQKTLRRAATEDVEVKIMPPGGGRNTTWELPDGHPKKASSPKSTDWDNEFKGLLGEGL